VVGCLSGDLDEGAISRFGVALPEGSVVCWFRFEGWVSVVPVRLDSVLGLPRFCVGTCMQG
jgi:hypothetical protein